jgi:membrane associated rhomboid family serine protease
MANHDPDWQTRLQNLEAEINGPQGDPISPTVGPRQPAKPPADRGLMANIKANALLPFYILAIPWAQEIIDQVFFSGGWNLPLYPRSVEGLVGIFTAAFSHSGFPHLIGNSIAFVIFSWLILAKSRRDYWITFFIGWLGGGAVAWLVGPGPVHGLSGVVYTLFGYLLMIGWLEKRIVPLMISVFVLLNYGAFIWGVLPNQPMVAWWGHLIGLLLGVFAAYGVYREPSKPTAENRR